MLDPVVKALEGSLGKRTYLCGNPDCGTLIIFHTSGARPVICHRCGAEIDWEGEYVTRIKICPKCNNEYDTNPNYCQFHSPPHITGRERIRKIASNYSPIGLLLRNSE